MEREKGKASKIDFATIRWTGCILNEQTSRGSARLLLRKSKLRAISDARLDSDAGPFVMWRRGGEAGGRQFRSFPDKFAEISTIHLSSSPPLPDIDTFLVAIELY